MVLCINGLLTLVFWIPSLLSFPNYSFAWSGKSQPQHSIFPADLLAQIRLQSGRRDDSKTLARYENKLNLPDIDGDLPKSAPCHLRRA